MHGISLDGGSDPLLRYGKLTVEEISNRVGVAKQKLGSSTLLLGHHYQRDEIVEHADELGDSFLLAQKAAASNAENIVFCGVHFMAESADILTDDFQKVVIPNTRAGCSMADMADLESVTFAWGEIIRRTGLKDPAERENPDAPVSEDEGWLVPVTYMNSSAELKAFVGEHGGVVCTSSNAENVLKWAFERAGSNGKLLFFPDQHLGRNTGIQMGVDKSRLLLWERDGKVSDDHLSDSRIILWPGHCSVHQRFTPSQVEKLKNEVPEAKVVVHPECDQSVVRVADAVGSTEYIKRYVENASAGSIISIGTEINMVNRLASIHGDKDVRCLDSDPCPCSTMYMIHPMYLLDVLERLVAGEVPNQVVVDEQVSLNAKIALDRMLALAAK